MLFNSLEYLIFLPLVVCLYWLAAPSARAWILLIFSYIFYAWWEPAYLLLIVFTTLSTYFLARLLVHSNSKRIKKTCVSLAVVSNLSILFVFKYFNFFSISLSGLFSGDGEALILNFLLPVGISFYTFQCLGYVIDVYREPRDLERSLHHYALYVTFFPQLVAGPIERASRLLPQLKQPAIPDYDRMLQALLITLWGFFLKLVIADRAAPYVNTVFSTPEDYSGGHFLIASVLFSYQIFCDFAGYSLIAIGSAKFLGIDLMQNFRRPYFARSVREFWARWHISLSTWFRDYLYIPLGGNRVSSNRQKCNLMIVFLVSGLWHGANWTFVVWGALHGLALVAETAAKGRRWPVLSKPAGRASLIVGRLFQHASVFVFVTIAWIFFRADSVSTAVYMLLNIADGIGTSAAYVGRLITPFAGDARSVSVAIVLIAAIALLEGVHLVQEYAPRRAARLASNTPVRWVMCVGLALSCVLFGEFGSDSFIYFQF